MSWVGVDLGSRGCRVAFARGRALSACQLIPDQNELKRFVTPSLVHIDGEYALVGEHAIRATYEDVPRSVVEGLLSRLDTDDPMLTDNLGRPWHVEPVLALLARKLLWDVDAYFHERGHSAFVSVPTGLNQDTRDVITDAFLVAGFESVELTASPAAIASSCQPDLPTATRLLVITIDYDTFEAGLVDGVAGVPTVAAHLSPSQDGIRLLADQLADKLNDLAGTPIVQKQWLCGWSNNWTRLWDLLRPIATGESDYLHAKVITEACVGEVYMERSTVSAVVKAYFDSIERHLQTCLGKSLEVLGAEADAIVITGLGANLPILMNELVQRLPRNVQQFSQANIESLAALGAALRSLDQGDASPERSGASNDILQVEVGLRVSDFSTGTLGFQPMIHKGTALPALSPAVTIHASPKDRSQIPIDVVYRDEDAGIERSAGIAMFDVQSSHTNPELEVTLKYGKDHTLEVSTRDRLTGQRYIQLLDGYGHPGAAQRRGDRELIDSVTLFT